LLAFHVAEGMLHQDEWMGARVNADWHFWPMTTLVAALQEAGLVADVKIERTPYVPHEHPTPRGYVLARRPVAAASSAGSE
jgi:hypothetical protein